MYFTPNDRISRPKAVSHCAPFENQAIIPKASI